MLVFSLTEDGLDESATRGGATVLKVGGGQNVIRSRKIFFLYPPQLEKWGYNFLHVGYEQGHKYHY